MSPICNPAPSRSLANIVMHMLTGGKVRVVTRTRTLSFDKASWDRSTKAQIMPLQEDGDGYKVWMGSRFESCEASQISLLR